MQKENIEILKNQLYGHSGPWRLSHLIPYKETIVTMETWLTLRVPGGHGPPPSPAKALFLFFLLILKSLYFLFFFSGVGGFSEKHLTDRHKDKPVSYIPLVVVLSRLRLCDPLGCSTPGFPGHHHLPELAQSHVHRVGDAIQPSSSFVPFSSCPQSFPASGSFQISQLFASGGQRIGASASGLVVPPMNLQGWFCFL